MNKALLVTFCIVGFAVILQLFKSSSEPETDHELQVTNSNMSEAPEEKSQKKYFQKVGKDDIHISRAGGWLTSRFHFSFADWWGGPQGFGALRVMNDDLVTAKNGFGRHPHRHMEIFSYIIEGYLSHGDSTGNNETLSRGDIQFMSAGNGVFHSEMNNDKHHTCRFIQTWIVPDSKTYNDSKVRYGSQSYTRADRLNKLLHVISALDAKNDAKVKFRRDCNVYVSELEKEKSVTYSLKEGRHAYLLCIEGSLNINNDVKLDMRDAVRLVGPVELTITAEGSGEDKFINAKRIQQDKEDARGVNKYPSGHFMMVEAKRIKPY